MALRMQEHTLGSRAKLLEEMAQHYEGYGKGVKTAMEEVRRGNLRGSSARWVSSFVSHPGIPWPWRLPWAGPCRTCW